MSPPPTVLIVDDDFDMRDTLLDIVLDEGLHAEGAEDGIAALAWLRSHPAPGVILLDWMMPRCNGAQFRAAQLADPALAGIPVVVLSADTTIDPMLHGLEIGHLLHKPVKLATLLEIIKRYCPHAA